jgi:palmitoyl-protein thioesterase
MALSGKPSLSIVESPRSIVEPLPLVVLHGLDSSSEKMLNLCEWLVLTFDVPVFNLEIGNGAKTSMYSPLTTQLDNLCDLIYSITELRDGFDFLGMSQGGLLARGYVEQCNEYPVRNLFTFVSPHGGEFKSNLHINMYSELFQKHLSIASYWRNPRELPLYFDNCTYLPILNNEFAHQTADDQRQNLIQLENFVLIWSPHDKVLTPPESAKFSFYDEEFNVVALEDTDIYKNDTLGLKYLNEQGRFHVYETNCSHVDHRNPICFSQLYNVLRNFLE